MIELPNVWRTLLVDALDDYCESIDGTSTSDDVAEAVIEQMEAVAAEVTGVEAEGVVGQLEDSMEAQGGLVEVLGERLRDLDDLTGEGLVTTIEAVCEIEYLDSDVDDEAASFFDAGATVDDDF